VQDVIKEKRVEADAWLRCIGLRKQNNARRDEAVWRKEIDHRIDVLLAKETTPLQKKDFDFRVRRFLHEFCVHSTVSRVSEVLSLVETSTAGKSRGDVRSWPAYLATLLRRFDPKLYENLADRDRRSRLEIRKQKVEVASGLGSLGDASSVGDHNADIGYLGSLQDDPEGIGEARGEADGDDRQPDGSDVGRQYIGTGGEDDSPPPDYTPRSSEAASDAASTPRSSASESREFVARPADPAGPARDLPDPSAGPGFNLFRYKPSPEVPQNAPADPEPRRTFQ
jgi:hypothetical protein